MSDKLITLHPYKNNIAYFEYNGIQQPIFYYKEGLYTEILTSCFKQIDNLLSYHRKVTIILLQLHQTVQMPSNKHLSLFIKQFTKKLKQEYSLLRITYSWVREEGVDGRNQHYHAVFMLNGSICNNSYRLTNYAKEIWRGIHPDYFVWAPKRNTFQIKRNDDMKQLKKARMRISYGAKKRSKELIPSRVRKYGSSTLQPKIKQARDNASLRSD